MRLPNVLSLQVMENEARWQEGNNGECQPVGHCVEGRQLSTNLSKCFGKRRLARFIAVNTRFIGVNNTSA